MTKELIRLCLKFYFEHFPATAYENIFYSYWLGTKMIGKPNTINPNDPKRIPACMKLYTNIFPLTVCKHFYFRLIRKEDFSAGGNTQIFSIKLRTNWYRF